MPCPGFAGWAVLGTLGGVRSDGPLAWLIGLVRWLLQRLRELLQPLVEVALPGR